MEIIWKWNVRGESRLFLAKERDSGGGEGLSKIQPVAKMCRWKLEKSRGKRDLEFGYPSSSFRTIFSGICSYDVYLGSLNSLFLFIIADNNIYSVIKIEI